MADVEQVALNLWGLKREKWGIGGVWEMLRHGGNRGGVSEMGKPPNRWLDFPRSAWQARPELPEVRGAACPARISAWARRLWKELTPPAIVSNDLAVMVSSPGSCVGFGKL